MSHDEDGHHHHHRKKKLEIPYPFIFTVLCAGAALVYQYGQVTERVSSLTEVVKEQRVEVRTLTDGVTRLQEGQNTTVRALDRITERLDEVLQRDQAYVPTRDLTRQ